MDRKVAVAGAGIVGLSIALKLHLDGYDVTVIDPEEPMLGASFGNAGHLTEANIFPPISKEILRSMPRLLFKINGPLVIQPSYVLSMLHWALRARRVQNEATYSRTVSVLARLSIQAIDAFTKLTDAASAGHLISREGTLYVFESEGLPKKKAEALRIWNDNGIAAISLSSSDAREMEPALSSRISGGIFLENCGLCSNPYKLGVLYATRLRQAGVKFLRECVIKIVDTGLVTNCGYRPFDKVILAMGIETSNLLKRYTGTWPPIASERGYHLMLPSSRVSLRRPTAFGDYSFIATPMDDGIRLAGTAEFAFADRRPNMQRAEKLYGLAKQFLPAISREGATTWMGVRSSTPDGLPFVGALTKNPRVLYAFGHGHSGLTLSAITAQKISDLVLIGAHVREPNSTSIERFNT
jgi:D-hydroxyproline dehydrogenase